MSSKHRNSQIFRALAAQHPGLFNTVKPVPLALGIDVDLAALYPEIPVKKLHRLLSWVTGRPAYQRVMVDGAERHALDGPRGHVTSAQAERAALLLEGFRTRIKELAQEHKASAAQKAVEIPPKRNVLHLPRARAA